MVALLAGCGGGNSSGSQLPAAQSDSTPPAANTPPATGTPPTTTPPPTAAPPPTSAPSPTGPPRTTNTGTALLEWSAPTTNTDGTPANNLAGYIIEYGNSPALLAQWAELRSPTMTRYTLTGLGSGEWYFAVSSYTTDGTRSGQSNVVSKTIE